MINLTLAALLIAGSADPVEVARVETGVTMAITIAHVDPKGDSDGDVELINRSEKESTLGPLFDEDNPFHAGDQVQQQSFVYTPLGSGFQEPWMQDQRMNTNQWETEYRRRLNQEYRQPISPVAYVAMFIVFALVIVFAIWGCIAEWSRTKQVEEAGKRIKKEREADSISTGRFSAADLFDDEEGRN